MIELGLSKFPWDHHLPHCEVEVGQNGLPYCVTCGVQAVEEPDQPQLQISEPFVFEDNPVDHP